MDWVRNFSWRSAAVLAVALFCALALGRSSVDSQTKKMWVAVMEDSPDAVVLTEADRWAEPVTVLKFNEQVEILRDLSSRDTDPLPYYRVSVRGFKGYVKVSVLSEKSQLQGDDSEASIAVGASAANNASKGLNRGTESTLRQEDPNFDKCVAQVERNEEVVNELISGGKDRDPIKAMGSYREFGDAGGLIAKEEK